MKQALIDDIYEAAFVPQRWEVVLDRLASISTSTTAAIMVLGERHPPRGMVSASLAAVFAQDFIQAGDWERSARVRTMLAIRPPGFVLVDDFVSAADSATDPVWAQLSAHGVAHQLCTMIPMPSGEMVTFTTERRLEHGRYRLRDIAALDALRPHLARSSLVSARLGLERARAATAAMEALGLPAAILTRSGIVTATNDLFEALSTMILPKAGGGIVMANPAVDALYQQSAEQMRSDGISALRSIPVPPARAHPAAVLHLLPMRGGARDIFSGADYMAVVSMASGKAASLPLLSALFDLTPAEARLAEQLLAGEAIDGIAVSRGVSITTIRSQLRSIFAKTGTSRQAQLVALLASLRTLPEP